MNMSQGKPLKLLTLFTVQLPVGNLLQKTYKLRDFTPLRWVPLLLLIITARSTLGRA